MSVSMRAMTVVDGTVKLGQIPKPTPGPNEVRIKVIASAVNPAEEKVIRGDFTGRFLHARTSPLVVGWDVSGTVDTVGDGVADVQVGDAVWGHLEFSPSQNQGSFAEYVTMPRDAVAVKPDEVSHQVAAAAATVTMTALQSLRDLGGLGEGGRALIIGAGGGIGSVAVGIASRLGAHVTGVCSTRDIDRVKALGADSVIDRRSSDPLDDTSTYDVIFDTPAVHSFGQCAHILSAGGTYVTTLPGTSLITGMLRALFSSKRCRFVQVSSRRADLELVGRWLSEGMDVPIDSRYELTELDDALRRQQDPARAGRVVVDVTA